MNRLILAGAASMAIVANGWSTAGTYTIQGNQSVTVPPVIDATNFVNLGFFSIGTELPFDFSNVQNYTNRNYMANFFTGFNFDNAPSGIGARKMSRTFYNAPSVPSGIATVSASSHLLISATNIVNRGLLEIGTFGLISIDGYKVDLGRGKIEVQSPFFNEGINDNYWFLGTNRLTPSANFVQASTNGITGPRVPPYRVVYPPRQTNFFNMALNDFNFGNPPSVTGTEFIYEAGDDRTVQIVFVRNLNTNITVQIESLGGSEFGLGIPTVQWSVGGTNTSGQPFTNSLYLTDTYGFNTTNIFITNGVILHPQNFSVSRLGSFGGGDLGVPFTDKTSDFWGSPNAVNAQYAANGVTISAGTINQSGQSPQLAGGRVEVNARDTLDMTYGRIDAYGYLKLIGTNHYVGAGSSSVALNAPYADIALGSTNGYMQIKGLMPSSVTRLSGTIDIYSAVWTNSVAFGTGTNSVLFNVILVDSFLTDAVQPEIFTLGLRSTNLVIGDVLNVTSNLNLKAEALTIEGGGEFNLGWYTTEWSLSAPGLKTFTNQGSFFSEADASFVGLNSNGTERAYLTFQNSNLVEAASIRVKAGDTLNEGVIIADYGSVTLEGVTNMVLGDGGLIYAYSGDINIAGKNLFATNHLISPGRALNLTITDSLNVGANDWTVYDGFNLWSKPTTGDLAEVAVTQFTLDFQEMVSTWAATDFGPVASGFSNNAALGSLTLDGGLYSLFIFNGAGPSSNALYVDVLYLQNFATNRDAGGNLVAVSISPGMKIYFGKAFIDDGLGGLTDITSELAGKNGGAFGNVDHSGPLTPTKPAIFGSPNLRVAVEHSPALKSLISWETPPLSTNSLYCSDLPFGSNWQLVTNFVSGPSGGTVTVPDPALSSSKFYKLEINSVEQ